MEVQLTYIHWIYGIMVLFILLTIILRKDTVLPSFLGIFLIGFFVRGDLIGALQVVFKALIASGGIFWEIIVVISLVAGMSKSLADIGADYLIMQPAAKAMINPVIAFWVLGFTMLIVSWFIWPSPAVALMGAIMFPVALRVGLPPLAAAAAINIFGHGIALSSDFFIQGAPSITAKAAGLTNAQDVIEPLIPLWLTCSSIAAVVSFLILKKELAQKNIVNFKEDVEKEIKKPELTVNSYIIAVLTPAFFGLDVFFLYYFQIKGGDATALIGGTATAIMCLTAVLKFKVESLARITEYIREGFIFGIRIFAPVVVIGGFFFMGSEITAKEILGQDATGFLSDIAKAVASSVPLSPFLVAFLEVIIGAITALDGSGFAGLPLVGSLAHTFGKAVSVDTGTLAALGQLAVVWVGGGTIVPWGLVPVAAVCGVEPLDLARRNIIPVFLGLLGALIVAMLFL